MSVPAALQSRGTDEWLTPPEVFEPLDELYRFRVDLAARTAAIARAPLFLSDALAVPWHAIGGPGWKNPPYSLVSRFIAKAHREMAFGFTTVGLINVATDTGAWDHHILSDERVYVRWIPGRVWFIAGETIYKVHPRTGEREVSLLAGERGPSPHPSCVVVWPGSRDVPPPPGGDEKFGIYRVDHQRPSRREAA